MRKSGWFAAPVTRALRCVSILALVAMDMLAFIPPIDLRAQDARAESLIGYTELSTNLPGGRHANVVTMRAVVSRADGSARRLVALPLASEPNSWAQFAGWSPDGKL